MNTVLSTLPSRPLWRLGALALRWLLAMALLLWALNARDPHLLPLRPFETPLLVGLALLGIGWVWRWPRQGIERWALGGVLVASLVLAVWDVAAFHYRQTVVHQADPQVGREIGQHFIVGYTDPADLRDPARSGRIGGVFITGRNVAGKSADALRQEIGGLQALRREAGLPPLIVATDQEGGLVSRLSPMVTRQPPLASLVTPGVAPAALEASAQAYGDLQGRELAALGITLNFSPVVDLKVERAANPLDFHSQIGRRAISADPAVAAQVATAYTRGLERHGVAATLKHFPGLGHVVDDTHHFSATLDTPADALRTSDWVPFREVARHTRALIMLGHVVLPSLDPEAPVSLSAKVVQGVIRGEWQHDGLLVTDDLTMAAAYNRGLCRSVPQALNAGVDLLLVAYDDEHYAEAMYCALRAHENRTLDPARLAASRARLARLQAWQREALPPVATPAAAPPR